MVVLVSLETVEAIIGLLRALLASPRAVIGLLRALFTLVNQRSFGQRDFSVLVHAKRACVA